MRVRYSFLIVYLALLTLYTHTLRSRPVEAPHAAALGLLPVTIAGYTGRDQAVSAGTLEVLGADQTAYREYRNGPERPIWLFLGYFGSQRERSQIHSPKHCYPGSGWSIYDESSSTVVIADRAIKAKRLLMARGSLRQVVLYWFQTDSGVVSNEYALKWHQMRNALLRRPQHATFVRFAAPIDVEEGEEIAYADLEKFIKEIMPHLDRVLNGRSADI